MKKRGRTRKPGPRTPSGQLSRARIDRGNERAQAKQAKYGTDGYDALGRAFRSGLLGIHGQTLLNTGRAICKAYWPMLQIGKEGCTLSTSIGGHRIDTERDAAREVWLLSQVRTIDAMGHDVRRAFDDLVIDLNPDYGPLWLDRLIARSPYPGDGDKLCKAIDALEMLAGVRMAA